MIALIDMDLVCFRCSASAENEAYNIALYRAEELLDNILAKTEATEYRAFLSAKDNFRKKVYPEYKANRTAPKPVHLEQLREHAMEKMNAELAENNLEADDMLGIHQTEDTIICSLDKDLLQIPGRHFQWEISGKNWSKPDTFIDQTPLEGLRLFYEQCLKGDTSDNIKGISGIGNKKAKTILGKCKDEQELFNTVYDHYATEDEFIMNGRCLWILRSLDDDFKQHFDRLNIDHGDKDVD